LHHLPADGRQQKGRPPQRTTCIYCNGGRTVRQPRGSRPCLQRADAERQKADTKAEENRVYSLWPFSHPRSHNGWRPESAEESAQACNEAKFADQIQCR